MIDFKYFNGTKADFENKASQHTNSIVFISGGSDSSNSCVYAHGWYFGNFTEFLSTINYFKGISVNGALYNALVGGGYLAFNSSNPSVITVNAGEAGIEIGLTSEFIAKVEEISNLKSEIKSINNKLFVGTLSEYEQAYSEGNIATGALVIILDESEIGSNTSAILGKAIIGTLLLGKA